MLTQSEYDIAYFEGNNQLDGGHPAGYSNYLRIPDFRTNGFSIWGTRANNLISSAVLTGKTIADFGCAYGHLVAELNDQGVTAYGLDWSSHAISTAQSLYPEHADKFILCDFLDTSTSGLGQFRRNEWDWVFSKDTLSCMDITTLGNIVPEWNRLAKDGQFHMSYLDGRYNSTYYYNHSLSDLQGLGFKTGSRVMDLSDNSVVVL